MMCQPAAPTRVATPSTAGTGTLDYSHFTPTSRRPPDKVDFSARAVRREHLRPVDQGADQNEIDVLYAANGGQFATGETFQQGPHRLRRH